MRNSQLVHPPMNRLGGLVEGTLEIGLVILFAVMMAYMAVGMMGRHVANVRKPAFHQGQHVFRGPLVEHPPITPPGDVAGGGVSKHAAPQDIVMSDVPVLGPAATSRQPGMT